MSEETFRIVEIVKFQELQAVPLKNVRLEDTFWSWRLQVHKDVTLEACLHHCEEKGRIRNFAKAAGQSDGEFEGIYTFNDTDVYKTLEGVAYSLMLYPNEQLEQKCDEIIDLIAAAQQTDGYLCTFFTLKEPDKKWTDMNSHEMYCGGHLMEAAVAYRQATGKNKLLDLARKLADHYDDTFGPGKRHWVEGHEEIGIGLVSLYRETGEERYWKLAQWLLEERGKGHGVGRVWKMEGLGPEYSQDHVPVRETVDVRGHAVRAMYLYSAVADIAAITRDREYLAALHRAWDSVVFRNMYITGGIGSSGHNEGFKEDYDLPNETAYCETCASIGMVYWNHRLNLLHADAKYADILERSLYNGVLAGVSLSGKEFFYDNPLASDGSHHRLGWFECSCCPTQVSRFIPTLGKYIYAFGERGIWVNLYVASTSVLMVGGYEVGIVQKENYPWEGTVALSIETSAPRQFEFNLRLPGWCKQATVSVNGHRVEEITVNNGYICLDRTWANGDTVVLDLAMPVERVHAPFEVKANRGKVALQRGPIVYCVEDVDHVQGVENLRLSSNTELVSEHISSLLHGVTVIRGYSESSAQALTAIPYYAWDNRSPGKMAVWLQENRT